MIHELWAFIFVATSAALYFILPFAYFHLETNKHLYSDSHQVSTSRKFTETLKQWTYFSITITSILWVIRNIMYINTDDVDVPDLSTFSYSLFTAFGSIVVLACLPRGFEILAAFGWQLLLRPIESSDDRIQSSAILINSPIVYKLNNHEERNYYMDSLYIQEDKLQDYIHMKKLEKKNLSSILLSLMYFKKVYGESVELP